MAIPTNFTDQLTLVDLQTLRTDWIKMPVDLSFLIAALDQEISRRIDPPTPKNSEIECECNGINRDGCSVCRAQAARIYGTEFEDLGGNDGLDCA